MKKIISSLLLLALVFASISLCVSCSGKCRHSWQPATCSSPKTCSKCHETEGEVGEHVDKGNGDCEYCNQDILLLALKNGFNIKLVIPSVGTYNRDCKIAYTNNTNYTITMYVHDKYDFPEYEDISHQIAYITYLREKQIFLTNPAQCSLAYHYYYNALTANDVLFAYKFTNKDSSITIAPNTQKLSRSFYGLYVTNSYLDNNSVAYMSFNVGNKEVWVKFGVDGPISFAYNRDGLEF